MSRALAIAALLSCIVVGASGCGQSGARVSGCDGGTRPNDDNILAALKETYNGRVRLVLVSVVADCDASGGRMILYNDEDGSPVARQGELLRGDDGKWHVTTQFGTAEVAP